uniref:Uncharacterized protein n=1 Tax=Anopheles atroparvus TaxID=41427 RepID=A0A182JH89_ANOAO
MPGAADGSNAQAPPAAAAGVPDAPIILNQNATTEQQAASNETDTKTPLAELPQTPVETTTVDPKAKQYIPPPGQYYPSTGQYVPPGEYDPATGIFTPGRYIPDTNIFQSGQYDPLTQWFSPGKYEANGQFIPDPNNPPLSLAANAEPGAAAPPQPETVTPAIASQLKTNGQATSDATMKTVSLLTSLVALLVSAGGFRLIVRF